MLFTSPEFMIGFLPVTLAGFALANRTGGARAGLAWLLLASLVFYGWWSPPFAALLAGSVALNFLAGRTIAHWRRTHQPGVLALTVGAVAVNLAGLGYFKYTNFFIDTLNTLVGTHIPLLDLVLPLAISFFTFQQIAFLLDAYAGQVEDFDALHYGLFVLFFPQLIIGPIVHHKEMIPQFVQLRGRDLAPLNLAIGLSIFAIGLFKKMELADGLAPYVDVVFESARMGQPVTLVDGWAACIGYSLQIYFDFSGYSDMALGLARMFGIVLPLNFNSPYRATSFIALWQRWHMTMTRFFTMYLYTPLSFGLMHRFPALAVKGRPRFWGVVALPLLVTFCLSGLWHGAAWGYVLCFALNGVALILDHLWRMAKYPRPPAVVGWLVTFTLFSMSLVFFRAGDVTTGWWVLEGMLGNNGVVLTPSLVDLAPWLTGLFESLGFPVTPGAAQVSAWALPRLALSLAVVFLPNVVRIFHDHRPALAMGSTGGPSWLAWTPSVGWAVALGLLLAWAVAGQSHPVAFVYYQF